MRNAIFYQNYNEMKIEINSYEKLEDITNDDFRELPEYMNMKTLDKVRMSFRIKLDGVGPFHRPAPPLCQFFFLMKKMLKQIYFDM